MDFYSYLWLREKDGTFPTGIPYYAGKGKGLRAFKKQKHFTNPPKDKVNIIILPMENEAMAFESEIALIALFGRIDNGTGYLRNLTDGGEGGSTRAGRKHSEVTKQKMREAAKGNRNGVGQEWSKERREELGRSKKGNTYMLGKHHSDKTCKRLSDVNKGKQLSEEHCKKISESCKGRIPWNKGRVLNGSSTK